MTTKSMKKSMKSTKSSRSFMSSILSPQIWGPKFWNVLIDTAKFYDEKKMGSTQESQEWFKHFYLSFAFLLPDSTCRVNYAKALANFSLDSPLQNHQCLKWIWGVHEFINRRINSHMINILPYETFLTRIHTWKHMGSIDDLWYICQTLGNIYNPEDDTFKQWFETFNMSLRYVIPYPEAQRKLSWGGFKPSMLTSREVYLDWVKRKEKGGRQRPSNPPSNPETKTNSRDTARDTVRDTTRKTQPKTNRKTSQKSRKTTRDTARDTVRDTARDTDSDTESSSNSEPTKSRHRHRHHRRHHRSPHQSKDHDILWEYLQETSNVPKKR